MAENIVDAIASGVSPAEVAQEVKDILFAKASERVDDYRQVAANKLFAGAETDVEGEEEWLRSFFLR